MTVSGRKRQLAGIKVTGFGRLLVLACIIAGMASVDASDAMAKSSSSSRLRLASTGRSVKNIAPSASAKIRRATAHGVLLKDLKTGRTLYEFESDRRMAPASLTKIVSALVILDYGRLYEHVTISAQAAAAHRTNLKLRAGQVFRLEDLVKAMLITSANDACLAAAEHVAGSEEEFVGLMNAKSRSYGLLDTNFSNACGFDAPDHYSTAADLARLSEVAMAHPVFREFVKQELDVITAVNENKSYLLRTTNRLLGRLPGVEGIKTGFTSRAGRCLIAKVSQDGKELLLVLLNARQRWNTAAQLLSNGLQLADTRASLLR